MRVVVVEPEAQGRTSGGYLYNQKLAEHGAFELLSVAANGSRTLEARGAALVLADSLFLDPDGLAPFLALRSARRRVGVLMHAFPSFIESATRGESPSLEPPMKPHPRELELLERVDLVVTPGAYVARVLAAAGSRTPCVVCPPGVDAPAPRVTRSGPRAVTRFLVLANLTPAKGVLDALRALSGLRDEAWELHLVGALDASPAYVAELRAFARKAGLSERVHFPGPLPHPDALAALGSSDVLVISSYTENCPLVALEALRAGVPVVGYAAGGLPDLVESSVAGLLVPPLDVAALAAALSRVVSSTAERVRLAEGAARAGARWPTWRQAAEAFQRSLLPYE